MKYTRSPLVWLVAVAVALPVLALCAGIVAIASDSNRRNLDAYIGGAQDHWDHRFVCRQRDVRNEDRALSDVYLWIRNVNDSQVPKYLIATDETFLESRYKPDAIYHSFWRNVEGGKGRRPCLDDVSVGADGANLKAPYCALSFDLGSLELEKRDEGGLVAQGLCRVVDVSKGPE